VMKPCAGGGRSEERRWMGRSVKTGQRPRVVLGDRLGSKGIVSPNLGKVRVP
jgi:hypothetical protein